MSIVRFTDCAKCDVEDAKNWYSKNAPEQIPAFIAAVDHELESIQQHSEAYVKIHTHYRKALLRRFPYLVVYEQRGDVLWVYGIWHTSRDPEGLKRRLRLSSSSTKSNDL